MSSIPLTVAIFREVIERRLQAGKFEIPAAITDDRETERLSTFTLIASFLPFLFDMTDINRGITRERERKIVSLSNVDYRVVVRFSILPIFSGENCLRDERGRTIIFYDISLSHLSSDFYPRSSRKKFVKVFRKI